MNIEFASIIQRIAVGAPGFLAAIVFHEAAHALMALRFGDSTAKEQGRLSLNPMVHYDLIGTVIFPLIGALVGGVMFGWAKPVPVNPSRFKKVNKGIFWVSFAGPLANVVLAIISAFLLAIFLTQIPKGFFFYEVFVQMLYTSLIINIVIAVFNLIPFPPLDGSKMVSTFLDYETAQKYDNLQQYSFVFILILWMTPIFSWVLLPARLASQQVLNFFIYLLG